MAATVTPRRVSPRQTPTFVSPVGKTLDEFIGLYHPTGLWIASGFISPDLARMLRRRGVERLRLLLGIDPRNALVSRQLRTCLRQLSQMETIEVRCLAGLHAKVYLAPKRAAIIGSANFSRNGFERLHEAAVLLTDAKNLASIFECISGWWDAATPLSRVKYGKAPPSVEREEAGTVGSSVPQQYESFFSNVGNASRLLHRHASSGIVPADVIDWITVDDRVRTALLRCFADCIAVLPSNSGKWNLTMHRSMLRLNVGPMTVLQAFSGWSGMHVDHLTARERRLVERNHGVIYPGFRSAHRFVQMPWWIAFPTDRLPEVGMPLLPQCVQFTRAVYGGTRWLSAHSQQAVDYIASETSRRLPTPLP